MKTDRRQFLAAGSSLLLEPRLLFAATELDTAYVNARIWTGISGAPLASAIGVSGERISAVGEGPVRSLISSRKTRVIDLKQAFVVPGFIDAHGHLMGWILYWDTPNLAPEPAGPIKCILDIVEALRSYIQEKSIPPGTLVFANGYDDSLLDEQRHPTREDLDEVSSEHPICIVHTSAHLAVFSSMLLDTLGFDSADSAPPGGVIRVDDDGRPTGVVEEEAVNAFHALLPPPDISALLKILKELQQRYASLGITTVEDGLTGKSSVELLQIAAALRVLFLDINVFPKWTEADAIDALPDLPRRSYVRHLKVGGVKITQDGSPQGKTAYLTRPYHKPLGSDYRGHPILSQTELNEEVDKAFRKGWQLHVHCNGDAAADMFLEAVAWATKELGPADRRPGRLRIRLRRARGHSRAAWSPLLPQSVRALLG